MTVKQIYCILAYCYSLQKYIMRQNKQIIQQAENLNDSKYYINEDIDYANKSSNTIKNQINDFRAHIQKINLQINKILQNQINLHPNIKQQIYHHSYHKPQTLDQQYLALQAKINANKKILKVQENQYQQIITQELKLSLINQEFQNSNYQSTIRKIENSIDSKYQMKSHHQVELVIQKLYQNQSLQDQFQMLLKNISKIKNRISAIISQNLKANKVCQKNQQTLTNMDSTNSKKHFVQDLLKKLNQKQVKSLKNDELIKQKQKYIQSLFKKLHATNKKLICLNKQGVQEYYELDLKGLELNKKIQNELKKRKDKQNKILKIKNHQFNIKINDLRNYMDQMKKSLQTIEQKIYNITNQNYQVSTQIKLGQNKFKFNKNYKKNEKDMKQMQEKQIFSDKIIQTNYYNKNCKLFQRNSKLSHVKNKLSFSLKTKDQYTINLNYLSKNKQTTLKFDNAHKSQTQINLKQKKTPQKISRGQKEQNYISNYQQFIFSSQNHQALAKNSQSIQKQRSKIIKLNEYDETYRKLQQKNNTQILPALSVKSSYFPAVKNMDSFSIDECKKKYKAQNAKCIQGKTQVQIKNRYLSKEYMKQLQKKGRIILGLED